LLLVGIIIHVPCIPLDVSLASFVFDFKLGNGSLKYALFFWTHMRSVPVTASVYLFLIESELNRVHVLSQPDAGPIAGSW